MDSIDKYKIAVFVSGRGTNLRAILESKEIRETAFVKLIISNKKCPALQLGKEFWVETKLINEIENIVEFLKEKKIDLIVLAGYLKKIPDEMVKAFPNKIINIHPALLPKYGGKGMYGMNVHNAVFQAGDKVSGATVHYVTENYDEGKIILQQTVNIENAETPEDIANEILEIEHKLIVDAIKKVLQ